MQVAACPDVTVVSKDDVPEEVIAKEREIEMGKQDLLEKPEQVRRSLFFQPTRYQNGKTPKRTK